MVSPVDDQHYHAARILVLIDGFSEKPDGLSGLTKLAKLDFLLRYPAFWTRLLRADGIAWPANAEPSSVERIAVESRMMRYKFGPWDRRYYGTLGELLGKGLIVRLQRSRGLAFKTSAAGRSHARELARTTEWRLIVNRVALLRRHYDVSGSALATRIYRELPDAVDMPQRQLI
jgi:hypothetical protein